MKKLLGMSALMVVVLPSIVQANDVRLERAIYADPAYQSNVDKARLELQNRGYQIRKIEADEHQGKKTLEVKAAKNGSAYDIRLDYPSLKIISEKRDN
ncbi:MAG: PepSY domain-containing protein [Moraxella sp.]|nr:PepSY domain-containing protein [Moraxella sp.]